MAKFAELFTKHMDEKGVRYQMVNERIVRVGYNADNIKTVAVYVIFDKEDKGLVQLRCSDILTFRDNDAAAIVVCNKLNARFRWVKFYVNDESEVVAESDAVVDELTCGEECLRLVHNMVGIVDEGYVDLMRAKLEAF